MLTLFLALLLSEAPATASFTARMLVTDQPDTVFVGWEQGEQPEFTSVQTVHRGETVAALILFSGCAPDREGNCNVTADIVVLDPSGKVYGESRDTELWVGRPARAARAIQLGVRYLMIQIEPKDPPGLYRIKARAKDLVSGSAVEMEHSFDVAPVAPIDSPEWPVERPKPDLAGFWKAHCEEDFGLNIERIVENLYSISFCGPGGCFEPGTYRPNSPIFGDPAYRVINAYKIEVLGSDGFSSYQKCSAPPTK